MRRLHVDPFEVLGVTPDDSAAQVKSAYRRAAKASHPDRDPAPGAAERFQAVKRAYDELCDPSLRAAAVRRRPPPAPPPRNPFEGFEGFDAAMATVIANDDAPRPSPRRSRNRGTDVGRALRVTLEEAFTGGPHLMRNPDKPCALCQGRGRFDTPRLRLCPDCRGTGLREGRDVTGTLACDTCAATGGAQVAECGFCGGEGVVRDPGVDVRIPAGATDGSRVVVAGRGAPGLADGPPGDLVVTVQVEPHETFVRRGNDLHATIGVPTWDRRSGTQVEVRGVDGSPLRVTVPPGAPVTRHVFQGRGMPGASGGRGDVVLTLCEVAPALSAEA